MRCPHCQTENPVGQKFCGECGGPLAAVCAGCGAANPPRQKFCGECGSALAAPAPAPAQRRFAAPESYTPKHLAEKILTSKSALEGERKQVTVLFVDVSGFTSMSERLDPEDVHSLMTRAFELMLAEVHRYEGTVNQFLGDGIMALFGAPVAHEDHARRAVHAALGIARALAAYQAELQRRGISFRVRQGLNTGLVVVGSIGTDLRMDYTAVGDTTNVAARLQQSIDPGCVVVAEATHRLVSGYFDTRPLRELSLRGRALPVRAWEVVGARGVRTRFEVEADRGLTPFVGRERELASLLDAFEKARRGQGQVVFLVGDPGIGKSRLLHEFRSQLGEGATWLEGHCVSFGSAVAFHPLIDLLKRTFRIEETDAEEAIVEKVEQGVLRLGDELRPILPYLRYLLSVDPGDPRVLAMSPQERRAEVFDALRRLAVQAAHRRPQVLVMEDLHWMDKATEQYLVWSADSTPASALLVILTYRPGYSHPFGERTYHTRISLGTLSGEDMVRMTRAMLATEGLPEELKTLVVRKSEGNPFFVEEVVKSLQEVGALRAAGRTYALVRSLDDIVIPDTIQDVIMARIDRLEDAPKKAIQTAAVIGREFTRRLLDRLSEIRERTEEFLQELKRIELIYEKSLYPELAYMFKHALTQDVAYNSLLVQRRKELHHLIALAIEELYADRLAEHYEILAHHFSRAEDWGQALDYLLKAAEKAARAFAIREAVGLCAQALRAAAALGPAVPPERRMALHRAKAQHHFVLGEFLDARAEGEQVLRLAREVGDAAAEAGALASIGFMTLWAQDFDGALAHAGQAIETAEAAGAQAALGSGYLTTGYVHALRGRLGEAKDMLDSAVRVSESAADAANQSLALQIASFLDNWQGDWERADRRAVEALRIARDHKLLGPLIRGLWARGIILTGKGDYDGAFASYQEGLALAERIGDANTIPRYLNSLGWLLGECGDHDRALEATSTAVEGARRWRHAVGVEIVAYCEINRGDLFLDRGDLVLAGEFLDEASRIVDDPATYPWMRWRYAMHLFTSLGELWLGRGNLARAREMADRGLAVAVETHSRKYVARGWRLRGAIAVGRRHWDEAEEAMRQALAAAQAIGNPPQLWRTHLAVARLHAERKNHVEAGRSLNAARDVLDRVKAGLKDARLQASLENAPLVREVYDLGSRYQSESS